MTNGYMKLFGSFIMMLTLSAVALFVVLRFSGTEAPPEPAPIPVATNEAEETATEDEDLIPVLDETPLPFNEILDAEVDVIDDATDEEEKTEVEIAADPDVTYLPSDSIDEAVELNGYEVELAQQDEELSLEDDAEFVFEPQVALSDAELDEAYAMEMDDVAIELVAEEEDAQDLGALPLEDELDVLLEEEVEQDVAEEILTVADAVVAANQLFNAEEEIVFDSNDLADYEEPFVEMEEEIVFDSNDLNDYETVVASVEEDEIVFDSNDLNDYETVVEPMDEDEIVFDSNDLNDYETVVAPMEEDEIVFDSNDLADYDENEDVELEEELDALIDELAIEEDAFDQDISSSEVIRDEESMEDAIDTEDGNDATESTIVIAKEEDFYDVSDLIDDSNLLQAEEENDATDELNIEVEEVEETESGEIIFDSNDLSFYGIVLEELDCALEELNASNKSQKTENTEETANVQENAEKTESTETAQVIFDSNASNNEIIFSQSDAADLNATNSVLDAEVDAQEFDEESFVVANVTDKASELTNNHEENQDVANQEQEGANSVARDSYDTTVIVEPTCATTESSSSVTLVSYVVTTASQESQPLEGQSDLLSQRPELRPDKDASESDSASLPTASEDSASLNEPQVGEDVNPSAEEEGFAVSGAQQNQAQPDASQHARAQQVVRAPLLDEVWMVDDNCSTLTVWKNEENQWRASSFEEFYATDAQERVTIFWAHGYQTDMTSAVNAAYVFRDSINRARRATNAQRSYRLVIWKWASERTMARMRVDAKNKIQLANMSGANLASVVAKMNTQDDVTFVGFSFGACVVGRALENLALTARANETTDRPDVQKNGRIALLLVCAACDLGAFDYYGQYSNASTLPNCVVNLYNPIDFALHYYPWASDLSSSALGVAPVQGQTFPNSFGRVYNINVSSVVARKHSFVDTIYLIPNDLLVSVAL
ncbi:MAG: hypothetical protein Q4G03_09840 [Planctomycetia bacterium]|nr:hypothetical protein [Planctomycetia bacterium]